MYAYRTTYGPRRPKRSSKPSVLAQRAGAWRHLWRVGRYANGSIVDPQEQNGSLSSLPLFPFHSVVTLHLSTTIIDRFRIN